MANPNPVRARQAKRATRAAKAGDIADVRLKLWQAVEAAADALADDDLAVRLRAVHATTQAAMAYTKVLEAAEFEARLAAVEKELGLVG